MLCLHVTIEIAFCTEADVNKATFNTGPFPPWSWKLSLSSVRCCKGQEKRKGRECLVNERSCRQRRKAEVEKASWEEASFVRFLWPSLHGGLFRVLGWLNVAIVMHSVLYLAFSPLASLKAGIKFSNTKNDFNTLNKSKLLRLDLSSLS